MGHLVKRGTITTKYGQVWLMGSKPCDYSPYYSGVAIGPRNANRRGDVAG